MLSRGELFDSLVGDLQGVPDRLVDLSACTVLDGDVGAGEVHGGGVLVDSGAGDFSLPKIKLYKLQVYFIDRNS